jgi:hypothetical protein
LDNPSTYRALNGGKYPLAVGRQINSQKWLQCYLNEFVWRYNRRYVVRENGKRVIRMTDRAMFLSLIDKATVDVERA